jgi:membrane-bound serine protease (ClpP class)
MATLLGSLGAALQQAPGSSGRPVVYSAVVDALIHPVSAEFIDQTIAEADAANAALVVLTLRTPGGLVDSTRSINTSIINAQTPVVVYVGPSGTRAASAGFLITIAADVAAMAPGTHIGAAHPVSGTGAEMDEVAAGKAASDVAAYARSIADQRGRNVDLAESAVMDSRSFTEREAIEADPPLVDLIATDLEDLLEQLDGRTITRWNGDEIVLNTQNATVEDVEMNWRQELLSAVAHPQVAVLLFSLGTLGLTVELWNPGGIVPGVVGGLCLLLAFFAFQILPINYVGLLLILFGLLLLVAEMLTATYGLLATGGIVSMILGAVMLIDSPAPELQLGWPFILSSMFALGVITALLVRLGVRSQLSRPMTGRAGMIEEVGEALSPIGPNEPGRVSTHGEIWMAMSDQDIEQGERVRVVDVDGMRLTVRRLTPDTPGGTHT